MTPYQSIIRQTRHSRPHTKNEDLLAESSSSPMMSVAIRTNNKLQNHIYCRQKRKHMGLQYPQRSFNHRRSKQRRHRIRLLPQLQTRRRNDERTRRTATASPYPGPGFSQPASRTTSTSPASISTTTTSTKC